ncbi:Basic leucine zipper and W2 domain-containing protein 1-A [Leucoagaricus sp. SymC.cos]|nr:Basic leucine zipper and W2 domain-containing protein 1-A [Leucoagaricus sp. SymC.cos]
MPELDNLWMSQQAGATKPSLQGVRIKARKGAVKAQAKHEPSIFRDQLYKHLETVPEGDFEAYAAKLVQAGSTLEFLKYADALFEIILVGGLLQPGGNYIEDGAPVSPFTIFNAKEPAQVDEIKKYIDVLNKLIRRYKYLQKPLEESSLPTLLQYIHRWTPAQTDKLAIAVGLLIAQSLATAGCLLSLTKDHLVKNRTCGNSTHHLQYLDVSINILTLIFRAYLTDQSMDHLSATLKRGGIKDLLAFFPPNKRETKTLEEHFRKVGLPQVADWWSKKQYAVLKDGLVKELTDLVERQESAENIVSAIKARQDESPIPDADLIQCIWQGCMSNVDWSARPDQIEGLALREVGKYAPILEPFCNGAKTQVTLINTVQIYCYEDTRIIKAFPQILKVLYNKDCISDQAIIYWHQKGSKSQGRQHFLKSTEALVKFLQEQDDSDEEEE